MSEHLDKARGAMAAARRILDEATPDERGLLPVRDLEEFSRLLLAAQAQATIAIAAGLEQLVAAQLELAAAKQNVAAAEAELAALQREST